MIESAAEALAAPEDQEFFRGVFALILDERGQDELGGLIIRCIEHQQENDEP